MHGTQCNALWKNYVEILSHLKKFSSKQLFSNHSVEKHAKTRSRSLRKSSNFSRETDVIQFHAYPY